MKQFALLLFMFANANAWAQDQPAIAYKGVALGASIQEYATRLPDHRCAGSECNFVLEAHCQLKGNFADCASRNTFGGADLISARATFRDGRLKEIFMRLRTPNVSKVMEALTEKLGAPTSQSEEPFRTQGGLVANNSELIWQSDDMVLRAKRHAGTLGQGIVVLSTPSELAAQQAERVEKAKQGAKDL